MCLIDDLYMFVLILMFFLFMYRLYLLIYPSISKYLDLPRRVKELEKKLQEKEAKKTDVSSS